MTFTRDRRALASALSLPLIAITPLVGCTSKAGSGESIAITATDTACEVANTDLSSGDHTFRVTNKGSDVTEVYVYGDGDKVMGEVENIGPGTSRDLKVKLAGGTYEVACKPGMKGAGIRTKITVSGDAAAPQAPPDRTVEVTADVHDPGWVFKGLDGFSAKAGETVEFRLHNADPVDEHELEVKKPSDEPIGEVAPLAPGGEGSVVVTFDGAGTYTYLCGIDNHAERGMKGQFTVSQ